ncbi:hypothetical protein DFH29DRAFT_997312 [Suillus ampliporus]|nr:hypothetical protein DFH29DRAFT_997312 [Suillus ampliporus]
MNSECRTLEELTANLESCQIDTSATDDFFSQFFVDDPIHPWDFRMNENQVFTDHVTPVVSPVKLTSPVGLSPYSNFTEHQSWDSRVLNQIAPAIKTRMASSVEAYLVRLQAAIMILRQYISLANPALHDANFGYSASPLMPFVPPVEVAPMSLDTEPGASAGISMQVPAASDVESDLEVANMSSYRRIFLDGDRIKAECLWPDCGKTLMKDNHSRHLRECHFRAGRGTVRANSGFHKPVS